ncbi:hypothetical protein ABZ566_10190, partial [Streptomyces hygroscopicus]
AVTGCALTVERQMLPPSAEGAVPEGLDEAELAPPPPSGPPPRPPLGTAPARSTRSARSTETVPTEHQSSEGQGICGEW